jgi:hypothetical protein
MLRGCSIVKVSRAKVITIEPSADALSVEEADKLFSMAFVQVCVEGGSEAAGVCGLAHFGLNFNPQTLSTVHGKTLAHSHALSAHTHKKPI